MVLVTLSGDNNIFLIILRTHTLNIGRNVSTNPKYWEEPEGLRAIRKFIVTDLSGYIPVIYSTHQYGGRKFVTNSYQNDPNSQYIS